MKFIALASALFCGTILPAMSADYSTVIPKVESAVRDEMREWGLKGIAVALVDDQKIIYEQGFGEAKADSIFRVGSISKLFNAIAVMQQAEAGRLDLDAPLPPEVTPINPFPGAPPVTLRQLLCHRSGLPREAPVGGYLDVSGPALAATVASIQSCVLVTRPGEKTRYSNIAPSIAGHLVERSSGQSFERWQRSRIFEPLGMASSAWTLASAARDRIIVSHMRVADGQGGWRWQETPLFDLGTIPAGNLFSTAGDLARFASELIGGGSKLLKAESLAEMWKPQMTDASTGFGLGFMVGRFREHRTISHNGAVYGHSTSLVMLPEKKIAVIVLGNEDIANGRIHRISQTAISLLLEAKFGEEPPAPPPPYEPASLAGFAGDYESQSYWARLEVKNGKLAGDLSGQPTRFTPVSDLKFTADSRIEGGSSVTFSRGDDGSITGFALGGQKFERVAPNPPPLPQEWRAFLGSYGPDIIPLIVTERHGHLYAMTENMVDYRMTPVNRNVCALPPGMYVDEEAVFLTDPSGTPHSINFASMILPRRK